MLLSRLSRPSLLLVLAAVLLLAAPAAAGHVKSLDEAKALAAEQDKLIVLDFGTDW